MKRDEKMREKRKNRDHDDKRRERPYIDREQKEW